MRRLAVALSAVLLGACGGDDGGKADASEEVASGVSFSAGIVPVLKKRCAVCHLTGQEPGNLALHPNGAWASLVGVQAAENAMLRVKPGDPDQSYLMHKIRGTHLEVGGNGRRMPFEGEALDPATEKLFADWIAEGAKNN